IIIMKYNQFTIFVFLVFLFITSFECVNLNFNLESMFNTVEQDQNAFDTDSDDLVLKMKSFFDTYADKLQKNTNIVDKLILPDQKAEYIKNFSIEDLNRDVTNFIEENKQMREKDLK